MLLNNVKYIKELMYLHIFRFSDESIWDIIQGDDREEAVKAVMDPAIHLGMKDQENM